MVADLGARVLVADGDASVRQTLFSRLLDVDIFSDCVANGRDALAKLAEFAYAVVILDLSLANVDAMQVLTRIGEIPTATRPVVLVLATHPDAARALDVESVQIVLRKPVDVPQLVELSRSCIRTRRTRKTADATAPLENGDSDHLTS